MLQAQMRKLGLTPLTYIPLDQLKAEVTQLVAAASEGRAYDEGRLDYLLLCLDANPEHQV
jgi:hypothetical protein